MRAILTGSKGFIGRNLKNRLKELDFEVIEINEDVFESETWQEEINIQASDGIDVIFHVGACSNTLEQDVNYIMKVNYEFTKQVAICAERLGIPLIYSSSAACYGINNKFPSNLYGWSKFIGEEFVTKSGGVALRYFNVYGPGEEDKGKMSSFLHQAFLKSKSCEKVELFPGDPVRDFVYIYDVIEANIFAFLNFNSLSKCFYEVGSGEENTFESVLALSGIKFSYLDKSEIPIGYQFFTKSNPIKWMDGWTPKYNLETGVRDYLLYLSGKLGEK